MSVQGVMWGTETGIGRRPTLAPAARTGVPPPSQLCMALHSHLPIPESGPLLNTVPGRPPWK